MHISLTLQPDTARARRTIRATLGRKLTRLYVLGGGLLVVGLVMAVNHVPLSAAPILIGAAAVTFPWLLPRAAAKAKTGLLAETVTFELTDTEVRARTPSLNTGFAWHAVRSVRETPEFWVVTVSKVAVMVVPWIEMPAEDATRVRAFLVERGLLAGGPPVCSTAGRA